MDKVYWLIGRFNPGLVDKYDSPASDQLTVKIAKYVTTSIAASEIYKTPMLYANYA